MDKNSIIREFDGKADTYEEYRLGEWYIAQLQQLVTHVKGAAPGDILDVGCGTGWLLRSLAVEQPDRRYVGVDISPGMIASARARLPESVRNVDLINGDWESLHVDALSDYEISAIVCTSAFHYFAEPLESLKKMCQVLREGGSLFLVERNKSGSPLTAVWDLLHRYLIKDHVRFFSSQELRDLLVAAGFSDSEILDAIRRYFWYGKLQTNIVYLRGDKRSR